MIRSWFSENYLRSRPAPAPVRYHCDKKGFHDQDYRLHLPRDLYFADMNGGNWDADGDDIYGEMTEDNPEVRLLPEVFVAEIPIRTPEQAAACAATVIHYEQPKPQVIVDRRT